MCAVTRVVQCLMDKIILGEGKLQRCVQLTTTLVQMVLFADDIVVCTERKEDMERNLAVMKVAMEKWGMRIHWGKTKVLMVSRSGDGCKVSVEGEEVEEVDKLKYLR